MRHIICHYNRHWELINLEFIYGSRDCRPYTDWSRFIPLLAYHSNQTYDEGLKLETLEDEFKHHFPYFVLERLAYSTVSIILVDVLKNKLFKAADYLPQEGLDAVKRLYGLAIKPFGRQLPEVVRCNQNCLDDLQKC